ncbi:hypothetical protein Mapa_013154 [Marchantia paleacea]|nr:hypothetical protein Mapa_013154 [Marchantia paleacea]
MTYVDYFFVNQTAASSSFVIEYISSKELSIGKFWIGCRKEDSDYVHSSEV